MPNHVQNRLRIIGTDEQIKRVLSEISSKNDEGEEMQIDFKKIIPMPQGLEANPHSGIETWLEICSGKIDFTAAMREQGKSFGDTWVSNGFNSMMNSMKTTSALRELFEGKRNVSKFSDDEFEIFIQCLRNFRTTGFFSWYEWSCKNWGTKWNAYGQNDKRNTADSIHFETAWSCPLPVIGKLSEMFPDVTIEITWADEDTGSNTGRIELKAGERINEFIPENQSMDAYEIYFEMHPNDRENYKRVGDKYEYVEQD